MRRSQSRIDADNRAIERGRVILATALVDFTGKHDASSIVQHIRSRPKLSDEIDRDKALTRYLADQGYKELIREALAEWDVIASKDTTSPQLDLFPEAERDIVRKIGLARIWVPTLAAHVQYHDLDDTLIDEAADYYQALSQGVLRTSVLLRQLAALRKQKPPAHKAA
jgi:hypothetical protein